MPRGPRTDQGGVAASTFGNAGESDDATSLVVMATFSTWLKDAGVLPGDR
jgi:hypothetical protein